MSLELVLTCVRVYSTTSLIFFVRVQSPRIGLRRLLKEEDSGIHTLLNLGQNAHITIHVLGLICACNEMMSCVTA